MSGDFSGENDRRIAQALEAAVSMSAKGIIEQLSNRGVSMAYIERALRLPQRTLARWKTGEFSAPGIALLRLIRTYPWLLSVADDSFDPALARQTLIVEAGKAISEVIAESQTAAITPFGPTYRLGGWEAAAKLTPVVAHQG
jgi:transcriptional regulator with XRE-family HTH domain